MKKLAHEEIIEQMKARIVSGEWKPGERLPTMQQLAEEFKLSRTAVREALRILENQRIVSIEHGRGVFVSNNPDLLEDPTGNMRLLEFGSLLQLLEARLVVEPEMAAFCAQRVSTAQTKRIRELAERMEEEMRQGSDHFTTDVQFHQAIAEGANNPLLAEMLTVLADLSARGRRETDKLPHMQTKAASYHRLIAIAIEERQADQARSLMRSHIQDMINAVNGRGDLQ
ncbi:FadR/GntR family transcriptional regulator [Cohnella silvisoli]|uniref:FadR/GntR family transcriptional regulator n=1 Tax=Cohnella silvisoli TaxID=2873699 RepID=A0ABV1KKW8_9BACL|nr:FadR/GntR family transcriptional regulator [Cohnella silvisoli]MCD9020864.1 FadR family transcriptional regulator [Cohnella silvisoli]